MTNHAQASMSPLTILLWTVSAISLLSSLMVMAPLPAQAQTFTILHSFTGGADGDEPVAGLTQSGANAFYGTTANGGTTGNGVVYRLSRAGTGWILTPLFAFPGGYYGELPEARAIVGPNGSLFGTTFRGGYYDNGTVFNLTPPVTACTAALCSWTNDVIYRFLGGSDGDNPGMGDLVFDPEGNIYGTTVSGGTSGVGTVYELTPVNGGWTENLLYQFPSSSGGQEPYSGVILDHTGNLYGTASLGGAHGRGVVYELSPSGSGWTESVLYSFQDNGDGAYPYSGLIFDQSGNLYGTTSGGGAYPTVFELSPSQGGGWTFSLIHTFPGAYTPYAGVTMDAAGNLYGDTLGGAYGYGEIFKLTPNPNGGWNFTDLYDFFGAEDGGDPYGTVLVDGHGNVFGTAADGGAHSRGVVWEVTP